MISRSPTTWSWRTSTTCLGKRMQTRRQESSSLTKLQIRSVFTIYLLNTLLLSSLLQEWLMWENQISTAMQWFSLEKDPVNFVLFYVQQPGNYIRTFGPNGEEAGFALQKVDQMIALLVEELRRNKLYEEVNIVLTGAHGFAEITADKVFDITQYLPDKSEHVLVGHSPVLNIFHSENQDLNIYASLSKGPRDLYDLYIHKDIPEDYHYKHNDRVGAMTLVAKEGFAFFDVWSDFKDLNSEHARKDLLENRLLKVLLLFF